jgi:hypothetical protein
MKRLRLAQVRQIYRPTDGPDAEGKLPAEDAPSNPAVVSVDKEAEAKAKEEAVRKERREGVRTGMKGPNPQLPAFEQVGAPAPRHPRIADPLASLVSRLGDSRARTHASERTHHHRHHHHHHHHHHHLFAASERTHAP